MGLLAFGGPQGDFPPRFDIRAWATDLNALGLGPGQRLVRETVAIGEQQTSTCTSAEWLGRN
jgi:hypothetical protein